MKKTLVILVCLALAILFACPALAQNKVLAETDSISWTYDQNGSLVGTIMKTDGVPAEIPAHIAGQLVEGKIPEYIRIFEEKKISKVFSFPVKVSIIQERAKITYSKADGWKVVNLPLVIKESKENYYFLSILYVILPAVFCIFLITLFHFSNGRFPESKPVCRWHEQDEVIYFTLPLTDGTTGEEWIKRLEGKGFRIGDYAKSILCSPDFKPTNGVKSEIAVLKGMLFEDNDRITKNIRAEADKRKLIKPNTEVACLIRENFSDKEIKAMGFTWIIVMHEPTKDSDGDPYLLDVDRDDDGYWLRACCRKPNYGWSRDDGFAFVVSQVGVQN